MLWVLAGINTGAVLMCLVLIASTRHKIRRVQATTKIHLPVYAPELWLHDWTHRQGSGR